MNTTATDFVANYVNLHNAIGFLMLVIGQFTLWPQALHTFKLKDATGLSMITCSVGLTMSLLGFLYASGANENLFFWLNYGSNTLASAAILGLKLRYS